MCDRDFEAVISPLCDSDWSTSANVMVDLVDGRQANGDIESAAGKAMSGLTLALRSRAWRGRKWGPARAEAALGRVATGVRAQDELAVETVRLKTAVCLGDLIEGDALGDARSDGASRQQAEEPLQVLPEPGGLSRPHQRFDRVDAIGRLGGPPPARFF